MRIVKLIFKYCIYLPIFSSEFRKSLLNVLKFKLYHGRKNAVVFYDRFPSHYSFSRNVINKLLEKNQLPIILIVGDKTHPMLKNHNKNIEVLYIYNKTEILFRLLNIKLMITPASHFATRFKPKGVNLVHIFHSIVSMHYVYGDGAFDGYDTFFAVGPHHIEELKRTQSLRGLENKKFLEIGYPKIEELVIQEPKLQNTNEKIKVLFAPSWGEYNLLKLHGVEIINKVLDMGYEIVVRPHPHSFMYDIETIQMIKQIASENNSCVLEDSNFAALESFNKSDILISDYSGAAYEYAFGLLKPVLFIDVPKKISSLTKEQLDYLPMEVTCREQIGAVTTMENFEDNFRNILDNQNEWRDTIKEVRKDYIFNPSNSIEKAVEAIIKLKEEIDGK